MDKMRNQRRKTLIIETVTIGLLFFGCSSTHHNLSNADSNFDIHLTKGKAFYKANELYKAMSEYKTALAVNPDSDEAHFLLGYVYFALYMQSHDAAQYKYMYDLFVNGKKTTDENTTPEELQGVYESYGRRDDYEVLATQEFTTAARLNPDNWMAHYHVAVDHLNHHRYVEAIKEYKQALQANPQHEISYGGLGKAYYELRQYDLAIENFKKSIALSSKMSYTDFELALAYLKVDQRVKAIEILERFKKEDNLLYDSLYCQIYGHSEDRIMRCGEEEK